MPCMVNLNILNGFDESFHNISPRLLSKKSCYFSLATKKIFLMLTRQDLTVLIARYHRSNDVFCSPGHVRHYRVSRTACDANR